MTKPKITETDISKLTPDPNNARKRTPLSASVIRKSIEQFGMTRSIVLDENGVILAGNGAFEEAGQLGIERVIVVETTGNEIVAVKRTNLTAEQKTQYAIADNTASDFSTWDFDILSELTQEVDLSEFFPDDKLNELLEQLGKGESFGVTEQGEENEEEIAELLDKVDEIESRVKLGEIWQLGRHRLGVGDSTIEGNVRALFCGDRAEITFTSPPYNLGASVGMRNGQFKGKDSAYDYDDKLEMDDYSALLDKFLLGSFLISDYQFINIQSLSGNKKGLFNWVGRYSDYLADVLIWVKTNPPPAMAEKVCNSAFEFVFVFASSANPNRSIKTATFQRGTFSNVYTSSVGNNSHTDGSHGATFPVEFADHYISNYSSNSAIIYDPFLGSGTSIIAAQKMEGDRTVYGFELSPQYCTIILERFSRFTGQDPKLIGHL